MLDLSVLPAFVAVILVFLAPPGPDMTYMLAVGLQGGRRAALRAILGIGTGMSIYAAAAVLGLGRVATDHPVLLDAVKITGAAYLVWLAVHTIRHARTTTHAVEITRTRRWYVRGLLVSLANPKLILFFVAVLPRFIGQAQNAHAQLALLGAVNVAAEVILYGLVGVCAGTFSTRFASDTRGRVLLHHLAAAVYLVLALLMAFDVLRAAWA